MFDFKDKFFTLKTDEVIDINRLPSQLVEHNDNVYDFKNNTIFIVNTLPQYGLFNLKNNETIKNLNIIINIILKPSNNMEGWLITSNSQCMIDNCSLYFLKCKNYAYVGLVGDNFTGKIVNCKVDYNTYHSPYLQTKKGWLVGENCSDTIIDNCFSIPPQSYVSNIYHYLCGGIIGNGAKNCQISNSYSVGTITEKGGGIIGGNAENCKLYNCYSEGFINQYAGGIAGINFNGLINKCYSKGKIHIEAGGICGSFAHNCAINESFSTGTISDDGGGIGGSYFGYNSEATINNCYSTGNQLYIIKSICSGAGGICGSFAGGSGKCYVNNSYSTGEIAIGGGGIVGRNAGENIRGTECLTGCYITNCYTEAKNIHKTGGEICGFRAGGKTQYDSNGVYINDCNIKTKKILGEQSNNEKVFVNNI